MIEGSGIVTGMLDRVLQSFLHDSEDAQGQIGRDARRNTLVGERDAGPTVREFSDKRSDSVRNVLHSSSFHLSVFAGVFLSTPSTKEPAV